MNVVIESIIINRTKHDASEKMCEINQQLTHCKSRVQNLRHHESRRIYDILKAQKIRKILNFIDIESTNTCLRENNEIAKNVIIG